MAEVKINAREYLNNLKTNKDMVKQAYQPLFEKDQKIGKAFKDFDTAIEERVKEVSSAPPKR